MKQWQCLIIDDETDAHTVLNNYCSRIDFITVTGNFFNALDALNYFKAGHTIDFIFLDINMPEINGLEFLNLLTPQPKVIFTTAYKEYALQSFEHNVADYLVKPIRFDRFLKAVNKIADEIPVATLPQDPMLRFEGIEGEIDVSTILYAASSGNYVKLHTAAKTWLTHATMQAISSQLQAYGFIRIHKQYTVQLQSIATFTPEEVALQNGTKLPIGISYRQYVSGLLNNSK